MAQTSLRCSADPKRVGPLTALTTRSTYSAVQRSSSVVVAVFLTCHSRGHAVYAGPHGAGLSNMLFAGRDVSVIEFAMKPHCNRCFGYMAMALDMDYWLVPQLWSNYHLNYALDDEKIAATVRVLRHVIKLKGLSGLLTGGADEAGHTADEL